MADPNYSKQVAERALREQAEARVAERLAQIPADAAGPRRESLERAIRAQGAERLDQRLAELRQRYGE